MLEKEGTGVPGVDAAVGNLINGRFSFEPHEEDCAVGNGTPLARGCTKTQNSSFSVEIDETVFLMNGFGIRASNDTPVADFPPANTIDILEFRGVGFNELELASSRLVLSLFGPIDALPHASIPADPTVCGLEQPVVPANPGCLFDGRPR